jgi:hypothetical protein
LIIFSKEKRGDAKWLEISNLIGSMLSKEITVGVKDVIPAEDNLTKRMCLTGRVVKNVII